MSDVDESQERTLFVVSVDKRHGGGHPLEACRTEETAEELREKWQREYTSKIFISEVDYHDC